MSCLQKLSNACGARPFHRSDSEVKLRIDDLKRLETFLPREAFDNLQDMVVQCLDNDPSLRPTAKFLVEALGIMLMLMLNVPTCSYACIIVQYMYSTTRSL